MEKAEAERLLNLSDITRLEMIKNDLHRFQDNLELTKDKYELSLIMRNLDDYYDNQREIDNILLSEISSGEKLALLSGQKAFERYITTVERPKAPCGNIYGEVDNKFTFSNHISLFQLNEAFYISEYVAFKQAENSSLFHRSSNSQNGELEAYLKEFIKRTDNNLKLVRNEHINQKTGMTTLSNNHTSHDFTTLQLEYLDNFLGKKHVTFISQGDPIAYGESEKGRAYVFGHR